MVKNNSPLVSVIIPNFNGEKFLERCLSSLFLEKEQGFEVIVVDDGSTDKSLELLKTKFSKEKRLKIISLKENVGPAKARNIGLEKSKGKYLFFLDNDTKVKPGWFNQIIQFFEKYPQAGIGQAKILKMGTNQFDYAGDFISHFGFLIERARSAEDKGQFDKNDKIFGLKSAAMLAQRSLLEKLDGFDQDYHIFWEDTDLAWRTWLVGCQVLFVPQITVWHAYGTKEKDEKVYQINKVVYRGCRNMITTLIKNLGIKRLVLVLPINIGCWLILALLFLTRFKTRNCLAILKGILSNLGWLAQTLKKRKRIQAKRVISDQELFSLVGSNKAIAYYLGKALAYIRGRPF